MQKDLPNIVVDEVSFVRDNCKVWISFLWRISSMA
jgi:hypothetical protein